MKTVLKYVACIGIAALVIGACSPSLSPFNQRLIDQNNWSEADLKDIQFYLSNDILFLSEYNNSHIHVGAYRYEFVYFDQ